MKAFALALVMCLSLLGAERARAADVPLPGPAPTPPTSYYPTSYYPVSPPINWGGVYIGLNGGYGLGQSVWNNSFGSSGSFATEGGVFGGTLGINYAGFGDWVLLGFEGDFDWSGANGSGNCTSLGGPNLLLGANATCQTRIDWLTTFRFRAGYTWSHFLFYATAGGAAGDFRISSSPTNGSHNPSPPLGWTAGVGVEYLFTDAISAKVEYLHVNLGSVGCPQGAVCSVDQVGNTPPPGTGGSVSFSENLIRAGVNYKFSW
jgi:outer membrane immunogenic protein